MSDMLGTYIINVFFAILAVLGTAALMVITIGCAWFMCFLCGEFMAGFREAKERIQPPQKGER